MTEVRFEDQRREPITVKSGVKLLFMGKKKRFSKQASVDEESQLADMYNRDGSEEGKFPVCQ